MADFFFREHGFTARRSARNRVDLPIAVRELGYADRSAILIDISREGFCVSCADARGIGEHVVLTLSGIAPLNGRILWRSGDRLGGRFVIPLLDEQYAILLTEVSA